MDFNIKNFPQDFQELPTNANIGDIPATRESDGKMFRLSAHRFAQNAAINGQRIKSVPAGQLPAQGADPVYMHLRGPGTWTFGGNNIAVLTADEVADVWWQNGAWTLDSEQSLPKGADGASLLPIWQSGTSYVLNAEVRKIIDGKNVSYVNDVAGNTSDPELLQGWSKVSSIPDVSSETGQSNEIAASQKLVTDLSDIVEGTPEQEIEYKQNLVSGSYYNTTGLIGASISTSGFSQYGRLSVPVTEGDLFRIGTLVQDQSPAFPKAYIFQGANGLVVGEDVSSKTNFNSLTPNEIEVICPVGAVNLLVNIYQPNANPAWSVRKVIPSAGGLVAEVEDHEQRIQALEQGGEIPTGLESRVEALENTVNGDPDVTSEFAIIPLANRSKYASSSGLVTASVTVAGNSRYGYLSGSCKYGDTLTVESVVQNAGSQIVPLFIFVGIDGKVVDINVSSYVNINTIGDPIEVTAPVGAITYYVNLYVSGTGTINWENNPVPNFSVTKVTKPASKGLGHELEDINSRNTFAGKKIGLKADSQGTFLGYSGNYYPRFDILEAQDSWWMRFILSVDGVYHYNDSVAGSEVRSGTSSSLQNRLTIPSDLDILFLDMGTNDFGGNAPLGSVDFSTAFTTTEFTDAFCNALQTLVTNYPTTRIIVLTPTYRLFSAGNTSLPVRNNAYTFNQITDRIIEVCNIYGVECIDMRPLGITAFNYSEYLGDFLHLKKNGAKMKSEYLIKKLL